MNSLQLIKNTGKIYQGVVTKRLITTSSSRNSVDIVDPPENLELATLNYEKRRNDPLDVKKARLLYQSRKRGMLENGILLSTFAHKYLNIMSAQQIDEYDKIINLPSNDWDIFYWAMERKPTPAEFDNEVMKMLKHHLKNMENRSQPPL